MIDYLVRRFKFAAGLLLLAAGFSLALAASSSSPPTGLILTSPVVVNGSFNYNGGPQTSGVAASGGTFTCTGGGTITVSNTNVTANSVFLFGAKTIGGTPANPIVSTVTPGTSFVATCGGSDTTIYNYIVLG